MPKDFDRFLFRFRQFGGWRLMMAYARMGVLGTAIKALASCLMNRKSLKAAYPVILERVNRILTDRYKHIIDEEVESFKKKKNGIMSPLEKHIPPIIWSGWLQGTEQAPKLVKACWRSQEKSFPGYEMRILTTENYHKWVELPKSVEQKFREGRIPPAPFSDLLRLAVLQKYGGVWMDASIYCSGFFNDRLMRQQEAIETSPFSIFRYFKRGETIPSGLSNWFIAAYPENRLVSTVLKCLLAYWHDYDCMVNYYIMHLFISEVLKMFPEAAASMPKLNSFHAIMLGNALGKPFNPSAWDDLTSHVAIHKLNYRKAEEAMKNPGSYCNIIISR